MSRLILHKALASPPVRSILILADMINVKLELRDVNLLKLEQKSPEYLKINPMGTVPTLEDGNFVLSESNAILKYILQKYGGAETRECLYPSDVNTRALVDHCMFFNAGVSFNALKAVGIMTVLSDSEGPTDQQKAEIERGYAIVDAHLQTRPYIATDHLTLADLAVGTTASASKNVLPLNKDKFPRCSDWVSRLEDEPCFKKQEDQDIDFFVKELQMHWENNKIKNKQTQNKEIK